MATSTSTVAIVGAGQAGLQVAACLRKRDFDGAIHLFGDEPHAPYQRPPLSKGFLKGRLDEERLAFRPSAFYAEREIELHTNAPVARIDVGDRALRCADGSEWRYDDLVLATGAAPVPISVPNAGLDGIRYLRGLDDARDLSRALASRETVVVVGGGYIGLEVAASARQLDRAVTVIERLPMLLSRVTTRPVADFILDMHEEQGVSLRLAEEVESFVGDGEVSAVRLASGESVPADLVVVGIGVRPNQSLAAAAGIDCDDGILVDRECRTSAPRVYAAGDCTRHRLPGKRSIRLESVHNALDQGERAAAAIAGDDPPPYDPPWFWSDQYTTKLQTVGLLSGYDDLLVTGEREAGKFSVLYFRKGRLIAVDAVADPATFMAGKRVLAGGTEVRRDAFDDAGVTLKDVIARDR